MKQSKDTPPEAILFDARMDIPFSSTSPRSIVLTGGTTGDKWRRCIFKE